MYKIHQELLSTACVRILLEILSSITSHAHQLNSDTVLKKKLQKACSVLEVPGPPIVSFENDSYNTYLGFLEDILKDNPSMSKEMNLEPQLVNWCEKILQMYLNCAQTKPSAEKKFNQSLQSRLPLSLAQKEELATRSKLVIAALRALSGLERDSFKQYVLQLFPFLVDLVRIEHSNREVQRVLSDVFQSCIGSVVVT